MKRVVCGHHCSHFFCEQLGSHPQNVSHCVLVYHIPQRITVLL